MMTFKMSIALMLSGALAIAPATAGAKRSKRIERVERVPYQLAQGVTTPVAYVILLEGCAQGAPNGCVVVPTTRNDRYISVDFEDASGQEIFFGIGQSVEDTEEFCGSTDEPIAITPTLDVYIFLTEGVCDTGTPSVATTGEVVATLSNRP